MDVIAPAHWLEEDVSAFPIMLSRNIRGLLAALAFAGGLGALRSGAAELEPSDAELALRELVARQQKIFADAEADDFDETSFRNGVQQLGFDYEDFLKRYPDYPPALTAYGVMLGRIDMRRESAALLEKANGLYAKAAEEDPSVRNTAFLKAWALTKNQLGNYTAEEGRPIEAADLFLSAIDLVPDEPLYHYQLGTLLTEARDTFLADGSWSREVLDRTMHEAFRKAAELAPDRIEFTYRYAESFYDLEHPDWDEALKAWTDLEGRQASEQDKQVLRLHIANVLIKQQRYDRAKSVLATVTEPALAEQKEKLVAQLPAASAE